MHKYLIFSKYTVNGSSQMKNSIREDDICYGLDVVCPH